MYGFGFHVPGSDITVDYYDLTSLTQKEDGEQFCGWFRFGL